MSNSKHKTGRKPLKLGTVENYHHHWYLLIWLVYLTLFAIAEHVVTDNYWVSYLPLDDKIPFCRYFIIPYCLWHPLLFLMTLYLMFYDAEGLKRYMLYIGLGFGGWVMLPLGLVISMSTVFVKQHSILDVFVAIPVCVILYFIIYHRAFVKKFGKAANRDA